MAKQVRKTTPKSAKKAEPQEKVTTNLEANQKSVEEKTSITKKAEEIERLNIDEQKQILQETDELASGILKAAYEVQKHSEINSMKEDLAGLRSAINALKTATALSVPNQQRIVQQANDSDCGCGEQNEKKCCVRIFGSGIRVINASDGPWNNTLELIVAIQAGGVKAVFPGLTSQINVNKNVGWVKVDWTITKICVPCNQQMTVPLLVEAMDIDKLVSVPEKGASVGAISVSCTCNPTSITIDVNLSSGSILGGEKKGQIMVEVSAERVEGECCC